MSTKGIAKRHWRPVQPWREQDAKPVERGPVERGPVIPKARPATIEQSILTLESKVARMAISDPDRADEISRINTLRRLLQ